MLTAACQFNVGDAAKKGSECRRILEDWWRSLYYCDYRRMGCVML